MTSPRRLPLAAEAEGAPERRWSGRPQARSGSHAVTHPPAARLPMPAMVPRLQQQRLAQGVAVGAAAEAAAAVGRRRSGSRCPQADSAKERWRRSWEKCRRSAICGRRKSPGTRCIMPARSPPQDGGQRIILITDRRLGAWNDRWKLATPEPLRRDRQAANYDFSVIELRLNAKDEGEGKASLAGKLAVDGAAKTMVLDNYDSLPVILKICEAQMKFGRLLDCTLMLLLPVAAAFGASDVADAGHAGRASRRSFADPAESRCQRAANGRHHRAPLGRPRRRSGHRGPADPRRSERHRRESTKARLPCCSPPLTATPRCSKSSCTAGANVNAPLTRFGDTALMMASRTGKTDAMKVLLDHGAKVNAKESWGDTTALMWAASEQHPDAVKLLVEHGADVNARSKFVPSASGRGFEGTTPIVANPARRRKSSPAAC